MFRASSMLFVCMMRAGCCEQSAVCCVCCVQCAVCNERGALCAVLWRTCANALLERRSLRVSVAGSVQSSTNSRACCPPQPLLALLLARCMVAGPDLRSTLAATDEAAFLAQRRLLEDLRDDILLKKYLTPVDSNLLALTCVSGRRVWWWWIHACAARELQLLHGRARPGPY